MTTGPQPTLRTNTEIPLDPAVPICDPHHHFWVRPNNRYMPEDFLQDTGSGHNIASTVFIECGTEYRKDGPMEMRPIGETEFARGLATAGGKGKTAIAAGIIGFADLTVGKAVDAVLEAHITAGRGNFRGVRGIATWDPHPEITAHQRTHPPKGLLLEAKFRGGFAILKRYGLVFDTVLYFHQLLELADLAKTFPDIPMVLNHVGEPLVVGLYAGKREEVLTEWRQGITALAACPNVVVKLGGLGVPRLGFGWDERKTPVGSVELAESTSPYYLFCIEKLGTKRCMFESDFPVDKVSYSYNVVWNAFKRMTQGFSPAERADLFRGTAARVYKLNI